MADSKRKQVLDGIVSACSTVSGISAASMQYENWWELDPHKFPRVWIRDADTEIENLCFPSATAPDMQARMSVECVGFVHDYHDDVAGKLTDLMSSIEVAVVTSTHVTSKTLAVYPKSVVTDEEIVENFGIAKQRFDVLYEYNHLSP